MPGVRWLPLRQDDIVEYDMRYLAAAVLLLMTGSISSGQTTSSDARAQKCALPVEQAPKVRGVGLGMSPSELTTLFPGFTDYQEIKSALTLGKQRRFGVADFQITPSLYPTKERFVGIEYYYLTLFDERVAKMVVRYTSPNNWPAGAKWERVEDFINKVVVAFGLPQVGSWELDRSSATGVLKCQGFEVRASTFNRDATLVIGRSYYEVKAKQRQQAEEERNRQEFKP